MRLDGYANTQLHGYAGMKIGGYLSRRYTAIGHVALWCTGLGPQQWVVVFTSDTARYKVLVLLIFIVVSYSIRYPVCSLMTFPSCSLYLRIGSGHTSKA